MSVTQEQFDKAFAEFQQMGPRRRIPLEKRWHEILPDIDVGEFAVLRTQCREIENFAATLGRQVGNKEISDEDAKKQIAQKYPSMTPEQIKRLWAHAIYLSVY